MEPPIFRMMEPGGGTQRPKEVPILTDVVLGAQDGIATLDTLRAAHPSASVIVMSGYSPTPERVAELSRQGAEFLPKPFGAVQLMAALDPARSAAS
jgi:DNA-binding NtrC family response regulator